MRQKITERLRKAGEAIRDFDYAYAQKVMNSDAPVVVKVTSGVPLFHSFEGIHNATEQAAATGLKAASAASRYALPAGGVALAGKGLYDLTQMMMGQQTSGTISPE